MNAFTLITIQPGNIPDVPYTPGGSYDPKLPLPYPYHVDVETGEIGRQEFWKGDPFSVIGFQKDAKVQTVDLLWDAAADDPGQIVGMFPVLIDTSKGEEGVTYTDTRPIISVTPSYVDNKQTEQLIANLVPAAAADLTAEKAASGMNSADVVNSALRLYHALMNEERDGHEILVRDQQTNELRSVTIIRDADQAPRKAHR